MQRALLVIDVQNEYFTGKMPITYPEGSFERILRAMNAANEAEIPVILIRHGSTQENAATFKRGSHGWELHEALLKAAYMRIIDKTLPGSFTGTDLEGFLREQDIDTVAICGYMSQMCCDTTARQAVHLGFSVEFLSDATGTLAVANSAGSIAAEELHKATLITQAMRFSKVMSADEWIMSIAHKKNKY